MKTYHGSCHCGAVRFEAELKLAAVNDCNCSICSKKGQLSARTSAAHFRLISGEEDLVLYQFNTNTAKHYFCHHCGIHPYSRPRADPSVYNVNVNCLDNYSLESEQPEVRKFDGRNWEAAVESTKFD